MTRGGRLIAGGICVILVAPLALTGRASTQPSSDGSSVVREVVHSVLDPGGDVRSTRVLQLIRLDGDGGTASVEIPGASDLSGYRNLSGFAVPKSADGNVEWRSSGEKDTVSLAETSQELPLQVAIRYSLDGREVSATDLEGETGDVQIEIDLVNVSEQTETLTHPAVTTPTSTQAVRVFLPIEYSVIAEFPTKTWRRVSAEHAYVQTNESGDEVVVRPGVLNPPIGPERDTVVLEAHGERISMPRIRVVASPRVSPEAQEGLDEQLSGLRGLHGSLATVNDVLETIYEGTLDILDGLEEMMVGVGQRDEATKEPVVTLDSSGSPTDLVGALGFLRNTIRDEMLPALGQRDPNTGDPVVTLDGEGTPETLVGAIGFIRNAIRDEMLPALGERDPTTGRAVKDVDEFGRSNTLLWGLQVGKDNYDEQLIPGIDDLIGGLDTIVAGLHTLNPDEPGLVDGLELVTGGLDAMIASVHTLDPAEPGVVEALTIIRDLAEQSIPLISDANAQNNVIGIWFAAGQLLDGIGIRDPKTGKPIITLDDEGAPETLLGGLGFMRDAIGDQMLPGIGRRDPKTGQPVVTLDENGDPTTLLGALGHIRQAALTNPEFTKPQPALDGLVPKDYFNDCPACWDPEHARFDPRTADPRFQPAFREAFVLFSEGLGDGLKEAHSLDPDNPGLIDALELMVDGLGSMLTGLHSLSPTDPGLIDGLGLMVDGLVTLTENLHTFDQDDPGLVDGLQLVRGGVQQVNQGLFSINELGVRTVRVTAGESADEVARNLATLGEQAKRIEEQAFLASADDAFTTYIFEVPAASETMRDNAVRGGLLAMSSIGLLLVGLRRRFLIG